MGSAAQTGTKDSHRWVVFGTLSAVYLLVHFHRVSPSVIAPDLLAEFQTQAAGLGLMSSMYFYLYALEQPVVGYLSDRLGPGRVIGLWSLTAAAGCLLFALAPSIGWASAGRALIGFGVGGVFIPGIKAFSLWFRQRDFSTLTGFFLAAGNLGGIMATTPFAWAVEQWGWRSSYLGVGTITLGLAAATLWGLRDCPAPADEPESSPPSSDGPQSLGTWEATRQVVATWRFWILFSIFFGGFGAYATLQGLWATPFLMSALGSDRVEASVLNMLMPAGFILGAPCFGRVVDKVASNRVHLLIGIMVTESLLWAGLVLVGTLWGREGLGVLFFIMGGITGGLATTFWSLVRQATPSPILGLTTGLLNPSAFLGSALLQVWTGVILDHWAQTDGIYPPDAYRSALWVCLAATALPTALALCLRKRLAPYSPSTSGKESR